jgi:hypothetical protein
MFRYVVTILVGILTSAPLVAEITPFPASFHTQMVPTNGTNLYVRVGGKGAAVVLLHGFGFRQFDPRASQARWTEPSPKLLQRVVETGVYVRSREQRRPELGSPSSWNSGDRHGRSRGLKIVDGQSTDVTLGSSISNYSGPARRLIFAAAYGGRFELWGARIVRCSWTQTGGYPQCHP